MNECSVRFDKIHTTERNRTKGWNLLNSVDTLKMLPNIRSYLPLLIFVAILSVV